MLMLWAVFPILASIFYCVGSYIQNHLTDNELPRKRAGSYVIMHIPCFIAAMVLVVAVFGRAVFMLPITNVVGLLVAGAINVIGSMFYYRALQAGDTIDITIFNQTSPLISLGLGVLILGESINVNQALGFLFIMAAVAIVVFGSQKKRSGPPNLKVATITLTYAFFSILSDVVYKQFIGGRTADFTLLGQGFFYFNLGSFLMSVIFFICIDDWRHALRKTFFRGKHRSMNLFLSGIDSLAYLIAEILYKLALILAPIVALVTAVSKAASLFASFFIALVLAKVFPRKIHSKKFTKKMIMQYLFAAVLILVGIVMMN